MKKDTTYIKSPLNYTGNKFRILPQILPYFPQNIGTMVDLFCGGATVGINTPCRKVVFIDNNIHVIGLLKYLSSCNFNQLLSDLERLIEFYHLSYSAQNSYTFYKNKKNKSDNNGLKEYNSNGFYQLREDYNLLLDKTTEKAYQMLYLLMVYGFNNDIRFSSAGNFNLPIGKTDLNRSNLYKLSKFIHRVENLDAEFLVADFRSNSAIEKVNIADFVYMDPPYLITNAFYNESGKWSENHEMQLENFLDYLLQEHKNFALSNVLSKKERTNEILANWIRENENAVTQININYHYRSASYNKLNRDAHEQEILIIPNYLQYAQNQQPQIRWQ